MSLDVNDVAKATTNIERIGTFLAPRLRWALSPGSRTALARVEGSLRAVAEVVARMLTVAEPLTHEAALDDGVEPLAPGTLDEARLTRIADFSDQLARWFGAHVEDEPGEAAAELTRLHGRLVVTVAVVQRMLGIEAADAEPPSEEPVIPDRDPALDEGDEAVDADDLRKPPAAVALGPATSSGGRRAAAVPMGSRETITQVTPTSRRRNALALDPAGKEELLVMRNDQPELSRATLRRLDEYLDEEKVVLSTPDRRHFERKVLRWIEAIPVGQILIIRITDLKGRLEPYARYQPRSE